MIKNKYAPIIESMRELSRVFGAVIEESEPTETRLYACGALPVSLTLPEGEHGAFVQYTMQNGGIYNAQIADQINLINTYGVHSEER